MSVNEKKAENGRMIKTIQIATTDRCNSKCIMCPHKDIYHDNISMHESSFDKLIYVLEQGIACEAVDSEPCLIMQFQNEPLCDVDLFRKARRAKNIIPEIIIRFYTNGLLFDKYKEELKSPLIDGITYSNYGDNLEDWQKVTGIKITQEKFDSMKSALKEIQKVRKVRIWDSTWSEGRLYDFSTRAGLTKYVSPKDTVKGCKWERPYKWLHINVRGDCVLCCQDWKGETRFGNVFEQSIGEIVESGRYKDMMQKATGKKNSDANFVCKRCKFSEV